MITQSASNHRKLGLSLRILLVGLPFIAIALGLFVLRWQRYQKQKERISGLERVGAVFVYRSGSPTPLLKCLFTDEQLVHDVREVIWCTGQFECVALIRLQIFSELESLTLIGPVPDITPLAAMPQLKALYLDYSQDRDTSSRNNFRENDIAVLAKIFQLERLSIAGGVSDLTPLADLTQLRELRLFETKVTDLSALSKMTGLKELCIEAPVTDITPLATLTQLRRITLKNTRVVDISALSTMTKLEELQIEAPISDIKPLTELPQLRVLWLLNSEVTDLTPLTKSVESNVVVSRDDTIQVEFPGRKCRGRSEQ